jgi:hypothetical protein
MRKVGSEPRGRIIIGRAKANFYFLFSPSTEQALQIGEIQLQMKPGVDYA